MIFNGYSNSATVNHFPLPPAKTPYGRFEDSYGSLRGRRYSQDTGVEEMSPWGEDTSRSRMDSQNRIIESRVEGSGSRSRPESSESAYGQIAYGTAQ